MTENELHRVVTIAKAEAIIELLFADLYDKELSYRYENGEQGAFGSTIRMVLDQMDGLMDECVEREEIMDEPETIGIENRKKLRRDVRGGPDHADG